MDEVHAYLQQLYTARAKELFGQLKKQTQAYKKVQPAFSHPYWYKDMNLYVAYPGLLKHGRKPAFDALAAHLPRIKDLGCNALHVLPFLESPMRDKGFDVSNFTKVRSDLGTVRDVQRFKKSADEQGIRVFMDLVFNHVSDQHEWFKKAQRGDKKYQDYFIHTATKPTFLRTYHKDAAVWAEYEINGKKQAINVAFPEGAGEIPHWREGENGLWYYHTYYPHQLDLNWNNPDVLLECSDILLYWASLGFHFRLDAIPFIGKAAYKETDTDHEKTYAIIALLKAVARQVNPECVLIVETYEKLDTVLEYFGTSNREQAELSYNFHLCTYLWVSLVTKNPNLLWKKWQEMQNIPHYSEWLNFLRNHDELSLAYLPDDLKEEVSQELLERGASFREGFGISGRTYSLLGNNERRFLMASFLLFSLQGGTVLVYGDEIGKKNVPLAELSAEDQQDTRNINRGVVTKSDFNQPKAQRISAKIQEMLHTRAEVLSQYSNILPVRFHEKVAGVLGFGLRSGSSELIVLVNLTDKKKKLPLSADQHLNILSVNSVRLSDTTVELGPYAGVWLQK